MWVISAEREEGKSLRRIRVRERWWFCVGGDWGWFWFLGVREKVQLSLGRKRGVDEEVAVVGREGCCCEVLKRDGAVVFASRMAWLVAMRSEWWASSHWVSQFPARKSGCVRIAARRSRLVLIPEMAVS